MSMKNSSDTIGNRTRDLPACSAVEGHAQQFERDVEGFMCLFPWPKSVG
jgi:hypothetical protein